MTLEEELRGACREQSEGLGGGACCRGLQCGCRRPEHPEVVDIHGGHDKETKDTLRQFKVGIHGSRADILSSLILIRSFSAQVCLAFPHIQRGGAGAGHHDHVMRHDTPHLFRTGSTVSSYFTSMPKVWSTKSWAYFGSN